MQTALSDSDKQLAKLERKLLEANALYVMKYWIETGQLYAVEQRMTLGHGLLTALQGTEDGQRQVIGIYGVIENQELADLIQQYKGWTNPAYCVTITRA